MFISAILVALLATCGQWWFFGPITKCLVYPLTTGTLVGVFMGDPMTGMLAGANIQLIYLGWISAGGTMPSNTIVAGIFGTAMTILSGADPTMAVTFAIPFSMLGLLQNQVYMTTNAAWIHQADKMLEKGNLRGVRLMNFLPSFCMAFLLYGVPAFAMVMFGSGWAESLINAVPENVISALQVVGGIMPALGIAMLLNYLGKKTLIPWFFGGFFLTVYSGLGLTAVSIFSAIIALILYLNQGKSAEQTEKKKVKRLSLNKTVEVKEAGVPAEAPEEEKKEIVYNKKLSKKTLIKTWLWTTSTEACYNYERLQALGAANLMLTPIRELYDTNERRVEELKKYMVFYNSEVFTIGPIINGIACSMEEARAKANAIVKQHEQTLTNVLNQHKGEAKRQSDVRIKAETVSARQQQNMAVSKAQLELKREYGKRQKELKQELFQEVLKELQEFMKTDEYKELRVAYIEKAARFTNGEDLKIYINPSDADKKEWLEERTGMTLTVSKENFVGGVRAVVKGRNVLIDHAYKGALEEEFQDFMFRGGTGIG